MTGIIVAGSRDFNDYELLENVLSEFVQNKSETFVICGGAKGADSLGARFAQERGMKIIYCPAKWNLYGKGAGPKRNEEMARLAKSADDGVLFAFWNGKSRGTESMINIALRFGLAVRVIPFK